MAERKNFYEMLDLDPSVDSWDEIRDVIDKKRNRWMMDRTHLSQARKQRAEEGLRYVEQMKQVLKNPVTRRQEREAFLEQRDAELAGKREELQRLIAKIKAGGAGCSTDQFQLLIDRFSGAFTPLEIEKELEAAGVPPGADAGPEAPEWERQGYIEADLAKDIALNFEICKQPDLYAFLGADTRVAATELFAIADRRYKESVRVGRTDEEATAEQKLAGICQTLFKSEDGKTRYDNTLRALPMRELHDEIDLAAASKTLRRSDLDELAGRGVRLGVEEADAYGYLLWYADQKRWEIVRPSPEEEAQARAKRQQEEMKDVAEAVRKAAEETRAEAERLRREREEIERQRREPPAPPPPERNPSAPQATSSPHPPPVSSILPPPVGLRVVPRGDGFTLTWQPVSNGGGPVSYCVVRKQGRAPADEGDGEFISEDLTGTHFDDTSVPTATDWHYAVYAVRGDEVSEDAALSGPHRRAEHSPVRLVALAALLVLVIGSTYALRPMNQPMIVSPLAPSGWPEVEKDIGGKKNEVQGSGQGAHRVTIHTPTPRTSPVPALQPPPASPPPPPRLSIPLRPLVTVVATGDQRLNSAVERYFSDELSRSFDVVSRSALDRQGVLVRAKVEFVSERELQYLGRRSFATQSRLNVDLFLVAQQRDLPGEWSESFEYTAVNVDDQVERAVLSVVNGVIDGIDGGWSRYRQDLGLTP